MSEKFQSIIGFYSVKVTDENINLKLFKAVLAKMNIKYSLSGSKKERELWGESFYNSRKFTVTDEESYHTIIDYSERNKHRNPFSGFPGFEETFKIIQFFCENSVEGYGSFFEYLRKSQYFKIPKYCVEENFYSAVFDLFYYKMNPERIMKNELYCDTVVCMVYQIIDNVIWNIMNGIEFETFENN